MPERCPDCNGTGKIALLVSVQPCQRCGGKGTLGDCESPQPISMQATITGDSLVTYQSATPFHFAAAINAMQEQFMAERRKVQQAIEERRKLPDVITDLRPRCR